PTRTGTDDPYEEVLTSMTHPCHSPDANRVIFSSSVPGTDEPWLVLATSESNVDYFRVHIECQRTNRDNDYRCNEEIKPSELFKQKKRQSEQCNVRQNERRSCPSRLPSFGSVSERDDDWHSGQ